MSRPLIDFHKVRSHDGDQRLGFEALCRLLGPAISGVPDAALTHYGRPDAGAEMLARTATGAVWAWQAKWLFSLDDSAVSQMDESFKAAIARHPYTTDYVFCLPCERPEQRHGSARKSAMQRWKDAVDRWTQWAREEHGAKVTLHWIGETVLIGELLAERNSGILRYFFDLTSLGADWFSAQIGDAVRAVGTRYDTRVNLRTRSARLLEALGDVQPGLVRLKTSFGAAHRVLARSYDLQRLCDANAELDARRQAVGNALSAVGDHLLRAAGEPVGVTELAERAGAVHRALDGLGEGLAEGLVLTVPPPLQHELEQERQPDDARRLDLLRDSARSELWRLRQELWTLEELLGSMEIRLLDRPLLLVTGEPGSGKTHLLCDFACERLRAGRPTVLMLGIRFVEADPVEQITRQLQFDGSLRELLAALDAAGQLAGCRALLMLDALNEGDGPAVWPRGLGRLLDEVQRFRGVALAVSCRNGYVEDMIRPEDRGRLLEHGHVGFGGIEQQAVIEVFASRGLAAPDVPLVAPEFGNPLLLKFLADSVAATTDRRLPRGALAVSFLYEGVIDDVERRAAARCDYRPGSRLAEAMLDRLAEVMQSDGQDWVTLERAEAISAELLPARGWTDSLLAVLLREDLLLRDRRDRQEVVTVAYQRLGDWLRARQLAAGSLDEVTGRVGELLTDRGRRWRDRGVLAELAVQLPERHGVELHDLAREPLGEPLHAAFLYSLLWRRPEAVRWESIETHLNLIGSSRAGRAAVWEVAIQVSCLPEHPLNAEWLHGRLLAVESRVDRDSFFSANLRWGEEEPSAAQRLVRWAEGPQAPLCAEHPARLAALCLAWLTASPHRRLRDRATKALVNLLDGRTALGAELVELFGRIDDDYVAQAVLAAAHGAALRSDQRDAVGLLAGACARLLRSEPPKDLVSRDHALGVLRAAGRARVLPPGIDLDSLGPPYPSTPLTRAPAQASLERHRDALGGVWREAMSDFSDFRDKRVRHLVGHFEAAGSPQKVRRERREAQRALKAAFEELCRRHELDPHAPDEERLHHLARAGAEGVERFRDASWRARRDPSPVSVDHRMVGRFLVKRVWESGYRVRRFPLDDTGPRLDRGRPIRDSFGDKGLSLALAEALARLADHRPFLSSFGRRPQTYRGPWQLDLRELDPSCLLLGTSEPEEYGGPSWWSTHRPRLARRMTDDERPRWLADPADLPDLRASLEVEDPDGERWLVLHCHPSWEESVPPENERWHVPHAQLWMGLQSALFRLEDLDAVCSWAHERRYSVHDATDAPKLGQGFLGEYPWGPVPLEDADWQAAGGHSDRDAVWELATSTVAYSWSADASIEGSLHGLLPSPVLCEALETTWSSRNFEFEAAGLVVARDPSVDQAGPGALVVRRDTLVDALARSDIGLLWSVRAGKEIYGVEDYQHDHPGWTECRGAAVLTGNGTLDIDGLHHRIRHPGDGGDEPWE